MSYAMQDRVCYEDVLSQLTEDVGGTVTVWDERRLEREVCF